MLPKLVNASKLRVEVEGWRSKARKLKDTKVTEKVLSITDEIIHLARTMDDWHDAKKNGFVTPNLTGDIRLKINKLRMEATNLLKTSA